MSLPSVLPPLIIIVGPTAVGKTETAICLAEQLRGEIVSADSRLFYRGMDIGTAKPSPEERRRVPHHLIDIANPDQTVSLAEFQYAASRAIASIHQRGSLPFLVGGTGQYIRAVTQGWVPPALAPNLRLRLWLEETAKKRGKQWLHERLLDLDPEAAARIDPRNIRRTIRALEVILGTGKRFSAQRGMQDTPYAALMLGLHMNRHDLYERIDRRIDAMFAAGFLQEVQGLLAQGYSPDLPAMSAIGYQQCTAVLRGKITLDQAKAEMKRTTRIFVRRQANWFKTSDPSIRWFEANIYAAGEMMKSITNFLKIE